MSCRCDTTMDIRGRCRPSLDNWDNCPAKLDTTYWLINNDADMMEEIDCDEDREGKYLRFKNAVSQQPYNLNCDDQNTWSRLKDLIAEDEDCDDRYKCKYCGTFMRVDCYEPENAELNCCADCIETHICDCCDDETDDECSIFDWVDNYGNERNGALCIDCLTREDITINTSLYVLK